jgi:hypothetical protein
MKELIDGRYTGDTGRSNYNGLTDQSESQASACPVQSLVISEKYKLMRNFEWFCFYGLIMPRSGVVWVRLKWLKYGLEIKKTPLLFSERHGYTNYVNLFFGWRLVFLKERGA